jgi:hypothetical protein
MSNEDGLRLDEGICVLKRVWICVEGLGGC